MSLVCLMVRSLVSKLCVVALLVVVVFAGESTGSKANIGVGVAATPPYAWTIETANGTPDAGLYSSIALDSESRPYISYVNDLDGTLCVASRVNATWSTEIVAGPEILGDTNIVVGPNHTLEVSYYNADTGWIMYGVKGPSGWKLDRVAQGFSEGYNRLALNFAGQPAIVYTSFEGYLRYASWNGTAWSIENVDNQTITSRYEDLTFDPLGRPHVSYYGGGVLLYAVRKVTGWTREVVDPTEYAGWYSRIQIDSYGWSHIAYYASANESLMYATEGPNGWTRSLIDSTDDSGNDLSFVLDSIDRPQIAYYQRFTGSLHYAIGTGPGWVRETVDSGGVVGWYTGIAVDSEGLPHISYYDWTDSSLRYAEGKVALQVRSVGVSELNPTGATLRGELVALGNNPNAEVGFEFRRTGSTNWTFEPAGSLRQAGTFTVTLVNLTTDTTYEFQAIANAAAENSSGATIYFRLSPPPPPSTDLPLLLAVAIAVVLTGAIAVLILRRRRRPKAPQSRPISYVAR